jgi:L-ascorbate metabolism protein UlaG (beta-lactamase superfamily)
MRLTHIGGPTGLIEAAGWRILTDPTFDPPGQQYPFGAGATTTKVSGPAIAATDIGPIDAVLLSRDQHSDNLDHLDHLGRTLRGRRRRLVPAG